MHIYNRFSATVAFSDNAIKLSDLKELMVQGVHKACFSIKRVIGKLRNVFARSTAIRTSDASDNFEKRNLMKLVL